MKNARENDVKKGCISFFLLLCINMFPYQLKMLASYEKTKDKKEKLPNTKETDKNKKPKKS